MVKKVTKISIIEQYVNGYDKKYYLRELATLLNKPHQTIKPYLEELMKKEILIKYKRKNIVEYGLNFKNKQVYDFLIIAEKSKLMEKLEKETILKILHEKASNYFESNTFVVFGSSTNKIEKGSDIDLLVIGKIKLTNLINEFEEVYNKKIHKIQVANLNKLSPALIKEIYKKHLILNHTEHIVRFFGKQYEQNKLV